MVHMVLHRRKKKIENIDDTYGFTQTQEKIENIEILLDKLKKI